MDIDYSLKKYVVVIQCHLTMQRCSGFLCEKSLNDRDGGFAVYPKGQELRAAYFSCGGCCGKASLRKLHNLVKLACKKDGITKDEIIVHLASCITRDNYHSPPCPHLAYLKQLLSREGVDIAEDTRLSKLSASRREGGCYNPSVKS